MNVKIFGRPPCPLISVKFEYLKEPNDLLSQLTEFIYKHAKTIDFSNEPPDYWLAIFKAVLAIKELGYDPRITGPPQHVLNQQAKVALVLNSSINDALGS